MPTPGKSSQLKVCHKKILVVTIAVFFLLMLTIYLMFGLRLDCNSSHREYFKKKTVVDISNGDIGL